MEMTRTYPVSDLRFWKAFWVHMRPYLLFISGAAGATGMIAADEFNLTWPAGLGFLSFFLAYGFGQALTDCFQVDTDRLSAPYRPLSKGIVTPRSIGTVAFVGLTVLASILVTLNVYNALFGVLSIAGLVTYSFVKRHFWWAGPFYNAWIVALLPMMGFLIGSNGDLDSLLRRELGFIVAMTFFAYTNFVLIGYLKDITADRETGYRTFPVVFGWNTTVWAGDLFAALGAAFAFMLCLEKAPSLIVWIFATIVAFSGQLYAHLIPDKIEKNAAFPITSTVRAFVLWHIAVVLAFRPDLYWMTFIYYAAFEWTLKARPLREQI